MRNVDALFDQDEEVLLKALVAVRGFGLFSKVLVNHYFFLIASDMICCSTGLCGEACAFSLSGGVIVRGGPSF